MEDPLIELPPATWARPETQDALHRKDIAALLRIVQQHGISQSRMGAAFGLGQGRVNEIVNQRREVVRLDVFTRIANGLGMPNEARILLGLAPRNSGMFTGHAEIAQTFATQADASRELRSATQNAATIDVLAVRALGLIALKDSLLNEALMRRRTEVTARILLLDPDSPAVSIRAREIGETASSLASGIRLGIELLSGFAQPNVTLQIALYSTLPTWRMLNFDDALYLSAFSTVTEGHRSGVYKLTAAANGVLHAGFLRHFSEMWRDARPL